MMNSHYLTLIALCIHFNNTPTLAQDNSISSSTTVKSPVEHQLIKGYKPLAGVVKPTKYGMSIWLMDSIKRLPLICPVAGVKVWDNHRQNNLGKLIANPFRARCLDIKYLRSYRGVP